LWNVAILFLPHQHFAHLRHDRQPQVYVQFRLGQLRHEMDEPLAAGPAKKLLGLCMAHRQVQPPLHLLHGPVVVVCDGPVVDPSVDHRRIQRPVPQELLDGGHAAASVQELGGCCVPQAVGVVNIT
jgi:hypothetical protein